MLLFYGSTAVGSAETSFVDDITDLWKRHNPREVFQEIYEIENPGDFEPGFLTELTGVRKIEKIAEGKGDEYAIFLNDEYILLPGFYHSLRVLNFKTGDFWMISKPVYHLADQHGAIFHNSRFVYYAKPDNGGFSIFQFDIQKHVSKPLCKINISKFRTRYDPDLSYIQFIDYNDNVVKTINLDNGSEANYSAKIPPGHKPERTKVSFKAGIDNLIINYDKNEIRMDYPRDEFLMAQDLENVFYSEKNPCGIFVKTRWYPGLHILFDLRNQKAYKFFIPDWIDIFNTQWMIYDDILYFWIEGRGQSGLYTVKLNEYPDLEEFKELLNEYGLAREKSNIGEGQSA